MNDPLDCSSKTWSNVSKKSKNKQNANQSSRHFTSVQCLSKSSIPSNFVERNRTKTVYNHELLNNLKDNEIKNAYELQKHQKHIVSYKSKNKLQSSEEKNIKEQLQKSKTSSNEKSFWDKRKNNYYDVFKSKIPGEEIAGVSKIPEVEIKGKQYKENYKTKSTKVILQNHYCNVNKGCIENNVVSHSTIIGISSSSDFPKIICQSSSHVKDLKEDNNNNKNQDVNKNDSYSVLVEHKSVGISKTREEIVQQRRVKVAARKKAKKTAIKQQKEEEYLKKSTSAKYRGVTMINNQDNVKENWEVTKENVSIPELSDFPCLGSIGKKKTVGKCLDKISQEVIRKGKPKKMDPISINILDAISHKKIEVRYTNFKN